MTAGLGEELDVLETSLRAELIAARVLPAGDGWRLPFPHELAARTRFAELNDLVDTTAAAVAAATDGVYAAVLEALAADLDAYAADPDAARLIARIGDLATPTSGAALPGVDAVIAAITAQIAAILAGVYAAAHDEAGDEAARQTDGDPPGPAPDPPPAQQASILARAGILALDPIERVLRAARTAVTMGAPLGARAALETAVTAASDVSRQGTRDLASQAAGQTSGAGRLAGLKAATPPGGVTVYASELLDRNTCTPCSHVDGREYPSLAAAEADYPSATYALCDGGPRCRGTLVVVAAGEEPPTVNNARPPVNAGDQ